LIPFSLLAFEISQKGFSLYNSFSSNIEKGALFGVGCISEDSKICSIINQAEKFNSEQLSKIGFDKQMKKFLEYIGERITEFILKIPLIIAEIFLMIVLAYYILADWENLLAKISDLLPMRDKTKNRLTKQFGDITHTVIYGQLFVALVQGMAGAIGFYVLGIPFPIMLGVLLGLFSFIPAIGTALIWVPASLYLILSGYFAHSPWILVKGIILFLYGLLVIGTIDNFLLARIVHKRAKVSPIIVIIGVIGGAGLFGVPGIFIGPILLPLLITYFKTFKEKFE
jgi:predicted PurR-regulated permease PerM